MDGRDLSHPFRFDHGRPLGGLFDLQPALEVGN